MPDNGTEPESKPVIKRQRLPISKPCRWKPAEDRSGAGKQPAQQASPAASTDAKAPFDLEQEWESTQQSIADWKKELPKAQKALDLAVARAQYVKQSLQLVEEFAESLVKAKAARSKSAAE
ncbi:hypothetical protein WJX77_010288 [Trebouxia sp. C0004]